MDRELILSRKRANSKRLRSDSEYAAREAEYTKEHRKQPDVKLRNLEQHRAYNRKQKFGVTREDFQKMKDAQDNLCAICGTSDPRGRGEFHIDHCHITGKLRGLLCSPCNLALGGFKDSPAILNKALEYLAKYKTIGE